MSLSTKRAVQLFAALALSAPARGGTGEPVSRPACIDLAMVGRLKSVGEPQPMNLPDDIIGHSLYRFDFNPARTLFGRRREAPMRLSRAEHALLAVDRENVIVFLRRWRGGHLFQAYEQAVPDLEGRLFIPLLSLPERTDRRLSWIPDGYRSMAREIPYSETRDGRRVLRAGLYVDDLAGLFARQRRGQCRR